MTGRLPVREKPHFTRERAESLAAYNAALAAMQRLFASPAMEKWVKENLTALTGRPTTVNRSRPLLTLDDDELRGVLHFVRAQRLREDGLDRPAARHAVAPSRPGPPGPRLISLAVTLLPGAERGRWAEEWAAEWADLSERPLRTRWSYLARLVLHGAPRLAWSARRAARRGTA
ncbi:hypothetical protein DMA15_04005 [Streptomyces sp. WAC 01529]|uniref:hypothetical protein n=1 Tax=Streptomyces sp. WAC 01529 TaxID=2203205 RepID=UPI000F6E8B6D|nr:hypothetical protein [Streptomyces sp. WAC 01529]AZM51853.1 hypothetical protein DMA15_04005 [Streptomyces sp. WAC 01529]